MSSDDGHVHPGWAVVIIVVAVGALFLVRAQQSQTWPFSGRSVTIASPAQVPAATGTPPAGGSSQAAPAAASTFASSAPAGGSPQLTVVAQGSTVTIRSTSMMPVTVSVSDGYGHALRSWYAFNPGDSRTEVVVTGRSYGYCFQQDAGDGYPQARACGSIIEHTLMNGVRIPDGQQTPISFTYAKMS